ncbi:MAG TPA: helix-turn-helix transcriptional regulator [Bacilli bacterium]|nr:helix-turn-helix transcriptional regulator [Bacilli bacterium]
MSKKDNNQTGTSLGARIREARIRLKLTQIELAQGLCTPSMISQVESDRARPSYKVLTELAKRLEVPMDKLLQGIDLDMELHSKYKMAVAFMTHKEYGGAKVILLELLDMPPHSIETADLRYHLGTCYLELGELEEAEEQFNAVRELATLHDRVELLAKAMMSMAITFRKKRNFQVASHYVERAKEEFAKVLTPDPTIKAWILIEAATLFKNQGMVEEVFKNYEELTSMSEEWMSEEGRGKVFFELAKTYHANRDYARAEQYASKAVALLEQTQATSSVMEVMKDKMLLFNPVSAWEETVRDLKNYASFFETAKEAEKASKTYCEIAGLYLENGTGAPALEKAQEYAVKARSLIDDTNALNGDVHRVFAFVCFRREQREQGGKHLKRAISIYQQHELLLKLDEVSQHYSQYLSDQGHKDEALEECMKYRHFLVETLGKRGIVL